MDSYVGFMVPGLSFTSRHTVWILKWDQNPLGLQPLAEVWLFTPDGQRICYVSDPRGVPLFERYHRFDRTVVAQIRVDEAGGGLKLCVTSEQQNVLELELHTGYRLGIGVVNLLLALSKRAGDRGKTETGKSYWNRPHKLRSITDARGRYLGRDLGRPRVPDGDVRVGDARAAAKPLLSWCTHLLEP